MTEGGGDIHFDKAFYIEEEMNRWPTQRSEPAWGWWWWWWWCSLKTCKSRIIIFATHLIIHTLATCCELCPDQIIDLFDYFDDKTK